MISNCRYCAHARSGFSNCERALRFSSNTHFTKPTLSPHPSHDAAAMFSNHANPNIPSVNGEHSMTRMLQHNSPLPGASESKTAVSQPQQQRRPFQILNANTAPRTDVVRDWLKVRLRVVFVLSRSWDFSECTQKKSRSRSRRESRRTVAKFVNATLFHECCAIDFIHTDPIIKSCAIIRILDTFVATNVSNLISNDQFSQP